MVWQKKMPDCIHRTQFSTLLAVAACQNLALPTGLTDYLIESRNRDLPYRGVADGQRVRPVYS